MNAPLQQSLMDTIRAPHFPIYMDYGATTPVDPRVVDAMIPWLREHFGNPASRSHAWGWEAEEAVEKARSDVATLINADPREIVWTSGATESNNLALKGAAHFYASRGKHLGTVKTEHKAVLDTMRELERQGFEVTYLDVQEDGLLDLDEAGVEFIEGGYPLSNPKDAQYFERVRGLNLRHSRVCAFGMTRRRGMTAAEFLRGSPVLPGMHFAIQSPS
jgi:selenocysteine lyase/cysteine desulfurase